MTSPCSIVLLESALAGNLPAQDETSLNRHLEVCDVCSAALERMAGGPAWCREAASMLATDALDAAVPTRDEWSEVDFTVEHLDPSDEPNVLGRLGGYDVLEIIGHGGMGVVLKAFDHELKRTVAIKVLAPHLARNSLARKRFAREAQAAAAVVHPHVLAIHQVQAGGRLPFLVMPLVAGESLAERLAAQGTLELKETLRIGMQAAAGLAAAHEQGLVHRDVKPANILLEKGVERAVLTDFGLARAADDVTLTRWGIVAGTPQYMSPEQARGEPLDGRSDLFSLGCVLYEMATGVSPFRTDSMLATMRRLVDDSPQAMASLNPELPPWFIAIVERLLEKAPSRRFNSAAEVSDLLENCLAHVQRPAAVPLPEQLRNYQSSTMAKRGRWSTRKLLALTAFVLALLVAGIVIVLETNKGTLTIESDADVALRITQGDKIVEELTVTQGSKNVRIAAGTYVVEIDGKADGITVKDGNVNIERGGTDIVKIVQRDAADVGHATDDSSFETFLAEAQARHGKNFFPVSLRSWWERWRPRLLKELHETKDPDRRRSIASSAIGIANGVVDFDTEEMLLEQLVILSRSEKEAARWQAELDGLYERTAVQQPARSTLSPTVGKDAFIAHLVARRIDELKDKFPHLELFSPDEHFAPGAAGGPELYSITYSNGVVAAEVPKSGPRRSAKYTYDPETGIQLDVHFFKGSSRGNDVTPPYRIGDLGVHVHVKGPAAEAIRGEIVRILEGLGAEKGPPAGATGTPSAPPLPAHPPTNNAVGEPNRDPPGPLPPTVPDPPPGGSSARPTEASGFSETKELVLSMDSMKFMLDLDTGKTMDPPATAGRPEQKLMDVHPNQVQPYHYPTGLTGLSLQAREAKSSDWNASAADVRRALAGNIQRLTHLDIGPVKPATYFFKTAADTEGILQLVALVDEPKGIRIRYKTVQTEGASKKNNGVRIDRPERIRHFFPGDIGDIVKTIACSADGKLIGIANGDPTFILQTTGTSRVKDNWKPSVRILDAETGEPFVALKLSSDEEDAVLAATQRVNHFEVTALAFSPVEEVVAVGTSIGQVKLFNARTGELVRSLDDEKPRLADKETPDNWKLLRRAMGSVGSLAFSPDGSLLAVCGSSFGDFSDIFDGIERLGLGRSSTGPGRLKVWDAKTGLVKHDLAGHSQAFDVAFSADGTLLASAGRWASGNDHGNGVLVWNPQTGEKMRTILIEANGGTHHVAFSPNKKLIVTGSVRFDKENDTSSTAVGVTYPLSGITEWQQTMPGWAKPEFMPDGKTLAVLSGGQSMRFVNVETGQLKYEAKATDAAPGARWNDFTIPHQDRKLAIGGVDAQRRGFVTVQDLGGAPADAQ